MPEYMLPNHRQQHTCTGMFIASTIPIVASRGICSRPGHISCEGALMFAWLVLCCVP
ncbi:unnamed protein product [Periconia digitata]|uniref:Uncharacterized protein n=1 Tax=Periconia digitata TaxID=1303443 RepID=A0A9W4U4B2_9PLEO|nr:unnamed protein product [Periconia digitata]